MADLTGKVALVTGGSGGIGAAIARRLAREGAAVALSCATAAGMARAVARQVGAASGRALVIRAGNAGPAAVTAAVEQAVRVLGRLDILVSNAGIFTGGPLEEMTAGQAGRLWPVSVRAVFIASPAAARHLGGGGRISTIGSALAGRVPAPGMTLYVMTKAALAGLAKGLAADLGPRGITATVIRGGLTGTGVNPAGGPAAEFLAGVTAPGRDGGAGDIAAAAAHLAGDGGRHLSGTAVTADGGFAA